MDAVRLLGLRHGLMQDAAVQRPHIRTSSSDNDCGGCDCCDCNDCSCDCVN